VLLVEIKAAVAHVANDIGIEMIYLIWVLNTTFF